MPSLKLRQDTVRSLPYVGQAAKQQCIYWDENFQCFGVRVHPSGRKMYVCSYRVKRRKRLASLGRIDALTLEQARRKATTFLGKVAHNEDPLDESDALRTMKTLDELCAAFIENHAKLKKKTWKDDESVLKRRILSTLKGRLAVSIVTADIEAIHAKVGTQYPYAANRCVEIVRKMFNWGRVAGFVPRDHANPGTGIVRFRERKRKRFITTVEMPRFVQSLEQEDSEYARHAIWMLLLTGLRSTELLKAQWTDVDWDMGTLFVGLTKNGDPLLTPLSEAALARLKTIPKTAGNPYIICGIKPGQHFKCLGPALKRVLKKAGLENIRVHDLRRTVGSWLAHEGRSLHLIGDVLNHRDPKTTAGYAYFQTQQRRDALTSHGDKVLTLGAPHLRMSAEPKAVSATSLLPSTFLEQAEFMEAQNVRHRHYFKREALYELVWTAPVSEIARRLGVSDVALAKLCRRAGIPIPNRGYWGRVEAGQPLGRPPLPPAPEGLPELLRIRGTRAPGGEAELAAHAA